MTLSGSAGRWYFPPFGTNFKQKPVHCLLLYESVFDSWSVRVQYMCKRYYASEYLIIYLKFSPLQEWAEGQIKRYNTHIWYPRVDSVRAFAAWIPQNVHIWDDKEPKKGLVEVFLMAKTYWPVAFTCGGIIPCAFTHYSTTQYPQTGWSIDTIAPLVQLLKGPNTTAHFGSAMSWTILCLEKTKTLWIHLHYRLLALVEKEQYFNMIISFLKKLGLPCVTDADVDRFRMAYFLNDTHPTFI